MPQLVTYHEQYFGMKELADKIQSHPLVKDKGFTKGIHLLALSNDHGVDFSVSQQDCEFRRMLADQGYAVARREQNNNEIGVSQKMRQNNMDVAMKAAIAYLYKKNGLLASRNTEEN